MIYYLRNVEFILKINLSLKFSLHYKTWIFILFARKRNKYRKLKRGFYLEFDLDILMYDKIPEYSNYLIKKNIFQLFHFN